MEVHSRESLQDPKVVKVGQLGPPSVLTAASAPAATKKSVDDDIQCAREMCRAYLHHLSPAWTKATAGCIEISAVTGGLTNRLYRCQLKLPDRGTIGELPDLKHIDVSSSSFSSSSSSLRATTAGGEVDGTHSNGIVSTVLVRFYNSDLGELSPREQEVMTFALLAERGIAPPLYGARPGVGRIEGWISNARALITRELAHADISSGIAVSMARLHNQPAMPLEKTGTWLFRALRTSLKIAMKMVHTILVTDIFPSGHEIRSCCPWLAVEGEKAAADQIAGYAAESGDDYGNYSHIAQSLEALEAKIGPLDKKQLEPLLPFLKRDIRAEISALEARLQSRSGKSYGMEIVFCHNDLQEGNVMQLDVDGAADTSAGSSASSTVITAEKLRLIDFEYAAYNYAAFDIANHFEEWAWCYDPKPATDSGYTYIPDNYPGRAQQENFARAYLQERRRHGSTGHSAHVTSLSGQHEDDIVVTDDDVINLLDDVVACAQAVGLLWALWGLQNACCGIEFGYLQFARDRLRSADHWAKIAAVSGGIIAGEEE